MKIGGTCDPRFAAVREEFVRHFGAGGSLGFYDPEAGVAFGYLMNAMGASWQNPRNRALIDAVYRSFDVPEGWAAIGQKAQGADP